MTYDQANRLQTTTTGGSTSYFTFDTTKGWRTSQGASSDENDPGRIRFTYTGAGRLATYVNPGTGLGATYSYDALGQRTQKAVTQGAQTITTNYTYEGLSLLRLEAEDDAQNPESWQITYLYDEQGRPYAGLYRSPKESTTPTVFALLTSDRGDVLSLLDAEGSPFAAYRYDAWGNPQGHGNLATGIWTASTNLIGSSLAAAIAERQLLRYAGYAYDQESSLYYLSARYYDPATRQFTSKDPGKADGEESAYQYCRGNPVGNIDHSGAYTVQYLKFPKLDLKGWDSTYLLRVLQRNAGTLRLKTFTYQHAFGRIDGWYEGALWWVDRVKDKGQWDYKRSTSGYWDITKSYIPFKVGLTTYAISKEAFGNINLGYTGAALGLPKSVLTAGSTLYDLLIKYRGWKKDTAFNTLNSALRQVVDEVYKDRPRIKWGWDLYQKHGAVYTGYYFVK